MDMMDYYLSHISNMSAGNQETKHNPAWWRLLSSRAEDWLSKYCWEQTMLLIITVCWGCFVVGNTIIVFHCMVSARAMQNKPCDFRAVCPELHEGVPPDGMNLSGSGLTSFSSAYSSSTLSPWKPLGGCTTSTLF